MSEQAPERPAPASGSRSRGGTLGLFTEKIGPLPMWGWVAIVAVLLIAYRLYADKKNASATSSTTAASSVPADQVPEFINQTYTTVMAPAAQPPAANPTKTPVSTSPTPSPPSDTSPPPKSGAPGMPVVKPGKVTGSSISGTWARVTGATSYHWRVTYQDKLVKQGTTSNPNVTVSGLDPDHTYTLHVAAVGPGGSSSETNGPGIKTTR